MRFFILTFTILAMITLTNSAEAMIGGKEVTFGANKGKKIEKSVARQNRISTEQIAAITQVKAATEENTKAIKELSAQNKLLMEKLIQTEEKSAKRLSKALSVIAKLIAKNGRTSASQNIQDQYPEEDYYDGEDFTNR